MENLNEGKKKASAYMAELAEIDKQSAVVAMEAKINKLAEMVEAKTQRLSMVHEDENLSELIDKKRVKMMEREIKEIERAKMKLEKLYEKMTGSKKKEMVDEEEKMDEGHGMDSMYDEDDSVSEGGYGSTTYEEDDSTYEEDNMKESTNEEYLRMQKLAGVISEEEYKNRLNEAAGEDLELKSLAKKFIPILKKYQMGVQYLTDTSKFDVKRPEDKAHDVPALLVVKDGVLQVAVYFMSLAYAGGKKDELGDNPKTREVAEKEAAKLYKELIAVLPEGEFEFRSKPEMNRFGNYILQFRKK